MHNLLKIISVILTVLGGLAANADSPYCEDLAAVSCKPAEVSDETGTATNATSTQLSIFKVFGESYRAEAKKAYLDQLNKNSGFLKIASEAMLSPADYKVYQSAKGDDLLVFKQFIAEKLSVWGGLNLYMSNPYFEADPTVAKIMGIPLAKNSKGTFNLQDSRTLSVLSLRESDQYSKVYTDLEKKYAAKIPLFLRNAVRQIDTDVETLREFLLDRVDAIKDAKTRAALHTKVKKIRFYPVNDCSAGLGFSYDSKYNILRVCFDYLLTNSSRFFSAFAIGHELCHSIDPCSIASQVDDTDENRKIVYFKYSYSLDPEKAAKEYPFSDQMACLRKTEAKEKYASGETGVTGGTSPFCSSSDQISQDFADSCGSELASQLLKDDTRSKGHPDLFQKGYSNIARGLFPNGCPHSGSSYETYRINKILSANPDVRTQMKCDPSNNLKHPFCPLPNVYPWSPSGPGLSKQGHHK